jgi:hypothetical protein
MADYVVVPGKIDIFVACNFAWSVGGQAVTARTPMKLGELADELKIELEQTSHPVPGDRNGGRAGEPIEKQFMSQKARANLELSVFDPEVANALLNAGGLMTTPGAIPQSAIGGFMLRDRSYRFIFRATTDNTRSRNFPATEVVRGHILGGGTKFEMLTCSLEMHRTPPLHWYMPAPSGSVHPTPVLFNTDMTGVPGV